jgi:hypothetical protein
VTAAFTLPSPKAIAREIENLTLTPSPDITGEEVSDSATPGATSEQVNPTTLVPSPDAEFSGAEKSPSPEATQEVKKEAKQDKNFAEIAKDIISGKKGIAKDKLTVVNSQDIGSAYSGKKTHDV